MGEWLSNVGVITLFVDDLDRSTSWYRATFDRPIVFEDAASAVFKFDHLLVNLLVTDEAHGLIAPAAVGATRGGARSQFTIWVEDAEATCAELRRRGVELINGPVDREWGQRTACFADPDGNVWEIAQTLA